MPQRLCLGGCGRLTTKSRCPACAAPLVAQRQADRTIASAVVAGSPACSCQGCGLHDGACGSTEDLTADHVVAISRGGRNEWARAVLCRRCNSSKGARR